MRVFESVDSSVFVGVGRSDLVSESDAEADVVLLSDAEFDAVSTMDAD